MQPSSLRPPTSSRPDPSNPFMHGLALAALFVPFGLGLVKLYLEHLAWVPAQLTIILGSSLEAATVGLILWWGCQSRQSRQSEQKSGQPIGEPPQRVESTQINPSLPAAHSAPAIDRLLGNRFYIRHAITHAPFPIIIHAEDGTILQMSKACTDITGYSLKEVPTIADWTERAYGERKEVVQTLIHRLYQSEHRMDEGEFAVKTSYGTTRTWTFSSAPLGCLPDGRRLVISMAADITDRIQAEAALATRLGQQAAVAHLGQQALRGGDLNELLHQTTELVAEQLQADYCKVLELLPDGQALLLRSGVGWQDGLVGSAIVGTDLNSQAGYTLRSQAPVVVVDLRRETRFHGPTLLHEHQVISGISTVIYGRDHQPFGVLGVHTTQERQFSQDDINFLQTVANVLSSAITRRQTEQAILQLNETLEQRVQERTRQLEEVNQELEAFSYSVAHDLRAPLRSIQGFAYALIEDCGTLLNATGQDYTHRLATSAEQLDILIQDLLTYSQLGRSEVGLQPISLDAVVTGVLEEIVAEVEVTQAQIQVHPLPIVQGQRSILKQVVLNLVTNAIKFVVPNTQPVVRIWAEPIERDDSSWVRLWIEDNGIGIAAHHQNRIFGTFERLHGIEDYAGTGIGLAIVQRGVERMGGRVGVESNLTQGSRFWVELRSSSL